MFYSIGSDYLDLSPYEQAQRRNIAQKNRMLEELGFKKPIPTVRKGIYSSYNISFFPLRTDFIKLFVSTDSLASFHLNLQIFLSVSPNRCEKSSSIEEEN